MIDGSLAVRVDSLDLKGHIPEGLILLRLDVTGCQETVLSDCDLSTILLDGNHRETNLESPVLHNGSNVKAGSLGDTIPEVLGDRVSEESLLEVDGDTLEEGLLTYNAREHAKDRTTLGVGDRVEDLVDLVCVGAVDFDRVRRALTVESESRGQMSREELGANLPLGEDADS